MNKTKLIIGFLFLSIFTSVMIVSCSKDEASNNEIKVEDYGYYHNQAIKLYSKKYSTSKNDLSKKSYNDVMSEMLELMKEEYPNVYKDVNLNEVLPYFKNYKSSLEYSFSEQWNSMKIELLNDGRFSQSTITFIDDILADQDEYLEIKEKLNFYKNNNNLQDNDKQFIGVFESVLESSNVLWFTEGSSNHLKTAKTNYCNHQIIIADAGASGMFLWTGPVAGIAGAAASLLAASSGDCA